MDKVRRKKKFAHGKNSGLESEGWGWMLHLCEIQSSSGKKKTQLKYVRTQCEEQNIWS